MQTRPRPKRYRRKNRRRKTPRAGKPNVQLDFHQIILRPLVTEKGTHQSTHHNAYCFQVNPVATKPQIKAAVEHLFPVRVESVRTQTRQGKKRRYKSIMGKLTGWKKAIVTLNGEDRIEFF